MDRSHIEPAADWRARITRGIELANAFIFVISPASAASAECMAELSAAVAQHKRIIPVVLSNVPPEDLPASLTAPNWIDFQPPVDRAAQVDRLIEALDADLEWRDAGTRLAARAREWEASDRDRSFLLRGADLKAAETWSESKGSHQELPTNQQHAYLAASRRGASRRLRLGLLRHCAPLRWLSPCPLSRPCSAIPLSPNPTSRRPTNWQPRPPICRLQTRHFPCCSVRLPINARLPPRRVPP